MKRGSSLRLIEWPMPPTSAVVRGVIVISSMILLADDYLFQTCNPSCAGRARFGGCILNGLDDIHVAGAAAQVSGNGMPDVGFSGIPVPSEQRHAGHHHPRRA